MSLRIPLRPLPRDPGYSLLEVLIALLVLSIGLLGLAALQLNSLELGTNSYFRTQATLAAYDIIDRMRGNPTAVTANAYHMPDATAVAAKLSSYNSCSGGACACSSADCTPANLALYDIGKWYDVLTKTLPGVNNDATVSRNPGTNQVTVTIKWIEKDLERRVQWVVQL
jgi:type IV pilus assembly protein PilV